MALVALADYLANTLVPGTCDLGFDPNYVDENTLIAGSGLTVESVIAEYGTFKEAVCKSSIYLDLR